jgi:hypothetical protein
VTNHIVIIEAMLGGLKSKVQFGLSGHLFSPAIRISRFDGFILTRSRRNVNVKNNKIRTNALSL